MDITQSMFALSRVNFASTIDTLGHLGGMDREPIAQSSMHMHFTQLSYSIPSTTLYIALINVLFSYYMFLQTHSNPEYMLWPYSESLSHGLSKNYDYGSILNS